jgi:hypothetical protein
MSEQCKHCNRCKDGCTDVCKCCGKCNTCGQLAAPVIEPVPVYIPYPYPAPVITPYPSWVRPNTGPVFEQPFHHTIEITCRDATGCAGAIGPFGESQTVTLSAEAQTLNWPAAREIGAEVQSTSSH